MINKELLDKISKIYGDSFYLLNTKKFEQNFNELRNAFRKIYPNMNIAYSYKTNYTPKLCSIVNKLGGFAEVVSYMEFEMALKIGVEPKNIIFNGPYKHIEDIRKLLLLGGTVNIDAFYEIDLVKQIAIENPDIQITVGIRTNFDINNSLISRFGFDVENGDFEKALVLLKQFKNIKIRELHCHFPTRNLESFGIRANKMLELVDKYFDKYPEFISLGGGLFGKMPDTLKKQFDMKVPSYEDYANVIATKFKNHFSNISESEKPKLILEPGSAIVADTMQFVVKVINIKDVRGKKIATVSGSMYNISPTLNNKNLPISVYSNEDLKYTNDTIDIAGYTCIESDYLYRGCNISLNVGDYIVFDNVGSYSIVLKPPFILPNFAILEYNYEKNSIEVIKQKEEMKDIFHTFTF